MGYNLNDILECVNETENIMEITEEHIIDQIESKLKQTNIQI